MNGLVRFRTRDGRYLSGGSATAVGGGLRAVQGIPSTSQTFAFSAGTGQPALTDGGPIAVAVCGSDWAPTLNRWTIISHPERIPPSIQRIAFGGPNTDVWVENWAPYPPPTWHPRYQALFTVRVSGGEISILVSDRQEWFFRVADDGFLVADGLAPFQADTAFTVEFGPFECAAVTGHVLDATSQQPLAGAAVVIDGGFTGTSDSSGCFSLVNAAGSTCVAAGARVLTATEERHRTKHETIAVPSTGIATRQILLECREIRGIVTDEAGIGQSDFSVTLIGPGANDPPESYPPDPNTGEFIFRCVRQGTYILSYPGAKDESRQVGEDGVSDVHLRVATSSVTGYVSNTNTGDRLAGASVRVVGPPPVPPPAVTQSSPDLGRYLISGVPSGNQRLRAERSGFSPAEVIAAVPVAGTANQDIQLTPVSAPATSAVFNTGVDQNRAILPGGAADPHWQVVGGPGITSPRAAVVVTNPHPSGQYYTPTDSAWIWVTADGSGPINQSFTFRLEFDLTSVSTMTRISGGWGCDNFGSIKLNNLTPAGTGITSVAGEALGNFNMMSFFTITSPFKVGRNTLEVVVTDVGNPGGLNVSKLLLTR
ncbi:carboxypeptidase regulatory-like domain-containing protein [Nonomuraea sp. NPDC050556]|uniref:carboxypeptidase regulatory-like domain-containing protein n=1 Tax=Nonomuraea sp. NPDC050556 TaxID=3364369 RepID=UPI00379A58FB